MLYFKVEYSSGLFISGTAYYQAYSKKGAIRQCKRTRIVELNMRTLRQIARSTYMKARGHALASWSLPSLPVPAGWRSLWPVV